MNDLPAARWSSVRFAISSLWKRRTQFALVLVTLVISFWSCFQIVALVTSFGRQTARDLENVGWDVINVHPALNPLRFLGHQLTVTECDRLAALVSGVAAPANPAPAVARPGASERPAGVSVKDLEATVMAIATTPAWDEVLSLDFVWGRFFRPDETAACVLDEWVFKRLHPGRTVAQAADAGSIELEVLGRQLSLRVVGVVRDPFRIRERLEELDAVGAARSEVIRFMEYKNVYLPRQLLTSGDGILAAVVKVGPGRDPVEDEALVLEYLEEKGSTAMAWSRKRWARDILEGLRAASAISHFLWVMILIITAFMVITVIFIVVRERYREIAIRRVEGARKTQIAVQLVLENLFLAFLANAVAYPLCLYTSRRLDQEFLGIPVFLDAGDVILVTVASAVVIALTTILPARRAAALDPVAVLRNHRA